MSTKTKQPIEPEQIQTAELLAADDFVPFMVARLGLDDHEELVKIQVNIKMSTYCQIKALSEALNLPISQVAASYIYRQERVLHQEYCDSKGGKR